MSSYGVIVPHSRLLINVNAQLDDHTIDVNQLLVITGPYTPESAITIQEYEEHIHSMLLDDWHAYKTIYMEFAIDNRSITIVRLLDGSQVFGDENDLEKAMMIARFVMRYESSCVNRVSGEKIQDHTVEIHGNDKEDEEETCVTNKQMYPVKEEEICVICLKEFEAGETCHALHECRHWYHKACIEEWLHHENFCPICRERVVSL